MFYILDLNIPREEVLRYYAGNARQVSAVARSGQRLVFPAGILRPFVASDGIRGTFRLRVNASHRLEHFERLA